jgi:arylsulfatase A-like enzyme
VAGVEGVNILGAVVGGEKDERFFAQPEFVERGEKPAELRVELGDAGVVNLRGAGVREVLAAGEPFHHSPQLAVRDGDWKLLMNPDRSRVELYDVKKDRTQLDNVAEHHTDVVARLSEPLLAWAKTLPPGPRDPGAGEMNAPWPSPAQPARKTPADKAP